MPSSTDGPSRTSSQPAALVAPPAAPPSRRPERRFGLIDRLRWAFRPRDAEAIREDFAEVLEEDAQAEDAAFSPDERAILRNVLALRELEVDDVMVPRPDIVAASDDVTLAELLKLFEEAEHSRLPVYRETLDDPCGIVHIKDLLRYIAQRASTRGDGEDGGRLDIGCVDLSPELAATDLVRPVLYVPPSMAALDLLAKMQAKRMHMALVIDEYGGTEGLVTLEDLIEAVVGDIEDEYDEAVEEMIQPLPEGGFVADARASLDDAAEAIGPAFEIGTLGEEVDTLGGLLVTLAGRVPARGEIVEGPGMLRFEVLDADRRRVKRLKVMTGGEAPAEAAPPIESDGAPAEAAEEADDLPMARAVGDGGR